MLSCANAHAFEFLGLKLFEDQSEIDAAAVIADPQPYSVNLETGSAEKPVEEAVRAASSLISGAATPASGAAGLLARARGDYRRILAALYGEGHYGGTISILVGGREASTLAPDVELPDPVAVDIRVNPGPLFRFGRVAIVNRSGPPSDGGDEVDAPELVGYGSGQVARSNVVLQAEQLALEAWQQQGYAEATVSEREVVADHDSNTVDVTIVVAPGRRASVGDIAVTGTSNMSPGFVARQTGLVPGAEYDPDDIARAERRLARLEVFRSMRIEAASAIGDDGLLPFNVVVEEQPLRRFGAGATYSTVDGIGIEGFHLWRNLFGEAERLRLDAKIAGIGYPINTAEFDYAFGGTFTKPGFLTPDTDLVVSIAAERTVLPTYTETSALARGGVTQYLFDELTLEGALFYERSRFDDTFGVRDFSLAGLDSALTFDNRDEPTNATEGIFAKVTAEPFYEFYYGSPAFRTTAEVRSYFGFTEDDMFVLAGRAKIGALFGPALAQIPPDRLFFAGGGGSVRGYGFKSIGVDTPGGVVGGRYLVEGSLEARVKVTKDIGVVGFLDGGYVAADSFPGLDQLRLGAGIGVRYYTGFGPLRLDLAFPVNKQAGDPDYALYAGIGQAF